MLIGNTVAEFLREWYGPPSRKPALGPAQGPQALGEWWAYEDAWETSLTSQNRVLLPAEVYRDAGHSVFDVENQAVWLWAYGDGSEPDVYDRENEPDIQWERVGERLSTFLHHVAVFEAVLGAEFTLAANDVEGGVVKEVLRKLSPSPFIDWRWPGPHSNVREGEGCLVFACVNDRPGSDVDETSSWMLYVAGRTGKALSGFDSFRSPGITSLADTAQDVPFLLASVAACPASRRRSVTHDDSAAERAPRARCQSATKRRLGALRTWATASTGPQCEGDGCLPVRELLKFDPTDGAWTAPELRRLLGLPGA